MTHIRELLRQGRTFSFEFFPPRSAEAEVQLQQALKELEPLQPSFVSVTYGAAGTTRERTHEIVVAILRETSMTPMAHLTCTCHSRAELTEILERYRDAEIENVMLLGGDPPRNLVDPPPTELPHAIELVELARSVGDFSIGVAAHPEGHPRSPNLATDRRNTAAKLARADFAVTQFFFRASDYLSMVDDLAALGNHKPVLPGIMPVTNFSQVRRMAELSGAEFPADFAARLEAVSDRP